jgi:hypothetical protein
MEPREIRTMRAMEWERAKGALMAVLQTYWSNNAFTDMNKRVRDFITSVEADGLQE